MDENISEIPLVAPEVPKKPSFWSRINWGIVFATLFVLCCFVLLIIFVRNDSYGRGFDAGKDNISYDVNSTYKSGFDTGYQVGSNVTVLSMLYYSRNCSVISLNYSDHVFRFVDFDCVKKG